MAPFAQRLKTLRRPPRDSAEIDLEEAPGIRSEVATFKQPQTHHRFLHFSGKQAQTPTLLALPHEVQLLIFQFLDFGEIEALRRTCRHFKTLLGHDAVIDLFGSVRQLHDAQLVTCSVCLCRTKDRGRIWVDPDTDRNWPLASKCTSCAHKDGDLVVDKVITLGDWTNCNICRWCGLPVPQLEATHLVKTHEFHVHCWGGYRVATIFHTIIGCLNWAFTLMACVSIWPNYREYWQLILLPALCLALLLVVGATQIYRTDDRATTYHLIAILHLFGLILWTLTLVYYWTHDGWTQEERHAGQWMFTSIVPLNVLFRVVDILGNVLLMTNYKPWMHNQHSPTRLGRIWRDLKTFLMVWTWPRCVEYSWPPERYWFPGNRYGQYLYNLRRFGTFTGDSS